MLYSRLLVPDLPSESGDHAHSPSVAAALRSAYPFVTVHQPSLAWARLAPFASWPMSLAQQLRFSYVHALATMEASQYERTTWLLDEAIDLAQRLDAIADVARLAYLRARAYYYSLQFIFAAASGQLAFDALLSVASDHVAQDLAFEVDLRDCLSTPLFLTGQFDSAAHYAEVGHQLVRCLPANRQNALRAANLDWTLALIKHWQGRLTQARHLAQAALSIMEALGTAEPVARLRVVLVNILLDTAAPLRTHTTYRVRLVEAADTHLKRASAVLHESPDVAGEALAIMASVRLCHLIGQNCDWLGTLEAVGRTAQDLGDLVLLGKSYTALGFEFLSRGETSSALNCLHRALGVFDVSQAPAEGIFARRAILHEQEMRQE